MLFVSAVAKFNKKNRAGRIPDFRPGREGQVRQMSQDRVDGIVTHVRNALRRASGLEDVDNIDIQPYLMALPGMAHLDARENGRANPANEASAVRTFLRVVSNARFCRLVIPRVKRGDFLPAWVELATASFDDQANSRTRRNPGWLKLLQNTLLQNGVRSPLQIPDYATIKEWSLAAGYKTKEFQNHISAYRAAREHLGPAGAKYPAIHTPLHPRVRGLLSLPNLEALVMAGADRLRAAGKTVHEPLMVDKLTTLELLDYIAPEIALHTRLYVETHQSNRSKSEDWQTNVVWYSGCVVAELVRLGEDVWSLDHLDLYLQRRRIPRQTALAAQIIQSKRALSQSIEEDVCLLRKVMDASAPRAALASPLSLEATARAGEVSFYPPTLFQSAVAMWSITNDVYGKILGRATNPETAAEWREVEVERLRVVEQMKEFNQPLPIVGHATRGMHMLTWGAAVCVGLWQLRKTARRLRTEWHQAFEKHRDESKAPVREARARYLEALDAWVVATVFLDDGMRVKQYARGLVGKNILLRGPIDPATGKLVSISAIHTRFWGYDPVAGLKISRDAAGHQRIRFRKLTQGLIDLELMTDYVFELRLDRLIRRGLVQSRATYNPAKDGFAFFVSSRSKRDDGAYVPSRLSKKVGKVIHHIARNIVGVRDANGEELPSWEAIHAATPAGAALRKEWRAVWNSHPVRGIIATYFGGVLKDWEEAQFRTNDTFHTLNTYYLSLKELIANLRRDNGLNHPYRFRRVIRRLLKKNALLDWDTFDPWNPDQARWITPPAEPQKPANGGKRAA